MPLNLTREGMVERMIDNDIVDIRNALFGNEYGFLYAVLSGEGWIPYNQLTDEQVQDEYDAREFEDELPLFPEVSEGEK